MPLATEFDDVYDYLIRDAVSSAGYEVTRADDIRNQRNILADIVEAIRTAALVIADLSAANPNVYYELGLAHAFGKAVILLAQDIDEVPFDLRSYRVVTYTTHFARMHEAREELKLLAAGARDGTVQFGSPVSDFSALSGTAGLLGQAGDFRRDSADDRGLLDFQSDLEDSFQVISGVMQEVGRRFHALNPLVSATYEQLQDNANTSSKRKRAAMRALASSMERDTKWLHGNNTAYRKALAKICESLKGAIQWGVQARVRCQGAIAFVHKSIGDCGAAIERGSELVCPVSFYARHAAEDRKRVQSFQEKHVRRTQAVNGQYRANHCCVSESP
jgi:hypothetical protein